MDTAFYIVNQYVFSTISQSPSDMKPSDDHLNKKKSSFSEAEFYEINSVCF
jgi:hypothetical protein